MITKDTKTEYVDGAWRLPADDEPEGMVTYSCAPLESTGQPGWIWWARPRDSLGGVMGEAATYDEARVCVEAEIGRRR